MLLPEGVRGPGIGSARTVTHTSLAELQNLSRWGDDTEQGDDNEQAIMNRQACNSTSQAAAPFCRGPAADVCCWQHS